MKKSHKTIDGFTGIFLGLGAPTGCLLIRMLLFGQMNLAWIKEEVTGHSFFYVYMTLTTPFVFSLFGFVLGFLRDKVFSKNVNLEHLAVQLEHQSITDDLTGLYNHRHLLEEVEREVERANRYSRILSGMMIDIDDFKQVNDRYGHLAGDDLLQEVASLLEQSIRRVDILGRYGGDEFFAILPESSLQEAEFVAERIHRNIKGHRFYIKEEPLSINVSIGLASFENFGKINVTTFIEKADQALLRAKGSGKKIIFSEQGRIELKKGG